MLIEMNVTNFRSFKEKQTLSMVTSDSFEDENKKNKLQGNAFTVQVSPRKNIDLLHSAVIYGANASGKSNFLKALATMHNIVIKSYFEASQFNIQLNNDFIEKIPTTPFKLDTKYKKEPTEFEVTILIDKVRYQYGFSATEEQIYDEWLFVYPKDEGQTWFKREWNEKKQEHKWTFGRSNDLTDEKKLWKEVWQKSTRDNALFLSTAVQFNSKKLKPLFHWFANTIKITGIDNEHWSVSFAAQQCENEAKKEDILRYLKIADFNIDDIKIKKINQIESTFNLSLGSDRKQITQKQVTKNKRIYSIHHDNEQNEVLFDFFAEESKGTQQFFALIAPFLDILDKGLLVFVDELDNSLHPKLVQFLVKLFHNKETNPKNAQLVFTTHDTTIFSQKVFRRDQIWFCEKNRENATILYSLSDFKPKEGVENLEAAYLSGRYGALPFIQDFLSGE